MTNYDTFEQWADKQIREGHDRHWIRRHEGDLRRRFRATGGADLEYVPEPLPPVRNRYDEL